MAAICSACCLVSYCRGGLSPAQFGQGPGESADQGRAVDALDAESCQEPTRNDDPGQAPAASATVMSDDDDLIAAVSPLRRQHPYLRAGREMISSAT